MLSFGASKVANVAKENALKYGSLASQKVVEVSQNVSEKVAKFRFFISFDFSLLFWFLIY